MFDFKNLVGMVMESGASRSGMDRMKHAMGDQGLGGQNGLLGGLLGDSQGGGGLLSALTGGGQSSGGLGGLASMAKDFLGGGGRTGGSGMAVGGLGALAGALLGGGGGAAKGAIGGGVMALLGSLAVSAIKNMNRPVDVNDTKSMPLGLREPEDDSEEEVLQNNAKLVLRAMINAAKSDGQIGPAEMKRITGKLQEAGADQEARNFVLEEMGKPLDLDGIVRDVSDQEIGAQVYAASLLAIEVDTSAEQDYLRRLAAGLQLGPGAVARIHQMLGVSQPS
jgi:uncharacterized membrane protein YebE (DUF533 family)